MAPHGAAPVRCGNLGPIVTDLERLELVLRRMHASRKRANETEGRMLNIDMQEFIAELADELAMASSESAFRGR